LVFVYPHNRIATGHDHFPEDILCGLGWLKISELWHSIIFPVVFRPDKVTHTHPHTIDMPALENLSKIFPKQHSLEPPLFINHINPQTFVPVSHNLKSLPQWL
jgi:hypothetical protein